MGAPVSKKHMGDDDNFNQEGDDLSSLAAIPSTSNSVSKHFLKSMFLNLHKNIQTELCSSVSHIHNRIDQVEECTGQIERQMKEFTHAYNEMVDSHADHTEKIQYLNAKVADMKERSRWNNIKFRGIPESIKNSDLVPYLLILSLSPSDLLIDRAHRIFKLKHPKVCACFHSFFPY